MLAKICYLGDDHLGGAAAYLAGIMQWAGLSFDYVPSADRPPDDFSARQYALYVLSDYPAARFSPAQMEHVRRCVEQGSGLLMIGGWESFFGRSGEYHGTVLADVLPVTLRSEDDRANCAQPCLVRCLAEHPITAGLPFDTPPCIGGFNRVDARPAATTLLTAVRFFVTREGDGFSFMPGADEPLLVVGRFGEGRTAALATDAAPHWVGGLVDWGDERIVQGVGSGWIEVGNWYARFFRNLLAWTGRWEGGLL